MIAMENGVGRLEWTVLKNVYPCIYSACLGEDTLDRRERMMILIIADAAINQFFFIWIRPSCWRR
jgi:hypothetical protein